MNMTEKNERQVTYLDGEPSPSRTEFENTVSRFETSLTKDMVYFSPLSGFEVTRNGTDFEVTSDSTLGLVPEGT